jgi:hypothetical protein
MEGHGSRLVSGGKDLWPFSQATIEENVTVPTSHNCSED